MNSMRERSGGEGRRGGGPEGSGTRRRDRRPGGSGSSAGDVVAGMTPLGIGLGLAGVVITVLALWLVARGDITAAPLLLVLAYLVLFPLALTR
jgi:hypothetical protein